MHSVNSVKKKWGMLSSEVYLPSGTELIPLFPYFRAGLLKKSGATHKTLPPTPLSAY